VRSRSPAAALAVAAMIGLFGLLGLSACDEKLQSFLKNAAERNATREQKKAEEADLQARGLGPAPPIDPQIAALIQVVRISDYDFIVRSGKRKGKDETRYNGIDFAGMLESKSRWLARGVADKDQWLEEIGSGTFFSNESYLVRLPDGREMSFRTWLEAELAALPADQDGTPVPLPLPTPEPAKP
jgi:hypothetical protein